MKVPPMGYRFGSSSFLTAFSNASRSRPPGRFPTYSRIAFSFFCFQDSQFPRRSADP